MCAVRKWSVLILPILIGISGCISPKSYVDPSYGKARYDDITRRAEPYKWMVIAEFQRNGVHLPAADGEVLGHVERVLRASGMAVPADGPGDVQLKVVVNNVVDMGAAAAKGFGTGLTFGLVGSMVTDYYEMEVALIREGKEIKKTGYKHALHTTIGNAEGPSGVEATTPAAGFGKVVEEMLLNALKDLEQDRELTTEKSSWLRKPVDMLHGLICVG